MSIFLLYGGKPQQKKLGKRGKLLQVCCIKRKVISNGTRMIVFFYHTIEEYIKTIIKELIFISQSIDEALLTFAFTKELVS